MKTRGSAGLDSPQRGKRSYVSAWVAPESKRRLRGAAEAEGIPVSRMLERMIDGLRVGVEMSIQNGGANAR